MKILLKLLMVASENEYLHLCLMSTIGAVKVIIEHSGGMVLILELQWYKKCIESYFIMWCDLPDVEPSLYRSV
jgi:hypothetical protein